MLTHERRHLFSGPNGGLNRVDRGGAIDERLIAGRRLMMTSLSKWPMARSGRPRLSPSPSPSIQRLSANVLTRPFAKPQRLSRGRRAGLFVPALRLEQRQATQGGTPHQDVPGVCGQVGALGGRHVTAVQAPQSAVGQGRDVQRERQVSQRTSGTFLRSFTFGHASWCMASAMLHSSATPWRP